MRELERERGYLATMARNLTPDPSLVDDLVQEGLICLWQALKSNPGQTHAFYMKGAKFRMLNYLNRGKSIDSLKRAKHGTDDVPEIPVAPPPPADIHLPKCLSKRQRQIAILLSQGLTRAQVAARLKLSTMAINRHVKTLRRRYRRDP